MKMTLSFKVDGRIKKALEKLAERENRSLSNYVVTLLLRHLEEKGIDWRNEGETNR
jgi:predicted transcriptional regulator